MESRTIVLAKVNQLKELIKQAEEQYFTAIAEGNDYETVQAIKDRIRELHREVDALLPYRQQQRGYEGF